MNIVEIAINVARHNQSKGWNVLHGFEMILTKKVNLTETDNVQWNESKQIQSDKVVLRFPIVSLLELNLAIPLVIS